MLTILRVGFTKTNPTIGGSVTEKIIREKKLYHLQGGKMTAVIYSNGSQECERMALLLKSLGGEFLEYKLGYHFTQRGFEAEFGENAEYPQINIGFRHIGNMKETLQHLKAEGAFV